MRRIGKLQSYKHIQRYEHLLVPRCSTIDCSLIFTSLFIFIQNNIYYRGRPVVEPGYMGRATKIFPPSFHWHLLVRSYIQHVRLVYGYVHLKLLKLDKCWYSSYSVVKVNRDSNQKKRKDSTQHSKRKKSWSIETPYHHPVFNTKTRGTL